MTPEAKRLIQSMENRIAMFQKSVAYHRANNRPLQASFWLDRIDQTEKLIIEIKTGLYQGEVQA